MSAEPGPARRARVWLVSWLVWSGLGAFSLAQSAASRARHGRDGVSLATGALAIESMWLWAVCTPLILAPSPPPADAAIIDGEHGVVQPGDPAALRDQAIAADTAFAALSVASGYTVAFTTYGAEAAVIDGAADYFWNAAGVAAAWAGWTPAEQLDWSPRLGREASYRLDDGTTVRRSYSKYLTVWLHLADGSWRFLLDAGNARPAPAP